MPAKQPRLLNETLLIYPLLGVLVGFVAGMFGIGGGLIIVPVLAYTFSALAMPEPIIMHMALGTSLATIVVTSVFSIWAHHAKQAVYWRTAAFLTVGLIPGAVLGAALAEHLSTMVLKRGFGIFAVLAAIQLVMNLRPASHRQRPGPAATGLVGVVIGGISALMGIGGGTLTTPWLVWCNTPIHKAIATAAACGFPIALVAAVSYIAFGLDYENIPEYSTGYIYWPAFFGIVVTSMLSAPFGARLAHRLSAVPLRQGFGVVLLAIGLVMVLN